MKTRFALALAIAASGCAGVRPEGVGPPMSPSFVANLDPGLMSSRIRLHHPSWMRPDAKRSNLLYATDSTTGQVFVYAYPSGKLEGILTNLLGPQGDCVDKNQNIWIPDESRQQVFEFAHGGTSPIGTLSDYGDLPDGCSIDPTTGDLAVANLYTGARVYPHAKGKPIDYSDPDIYFLGYDNRGNLFIDGTTKSGYFQFSELPKGENSFVNFSLSGGVPGGVEWDGTYITYGDQAYGIVSEVAVYGSTAKVVRQTTLSGASDPVYHYTFSDFTAGGAARRLVGTDFTDGTVAVWNYPEGGLPRKILTGKYYPTGVAISLAR